MARLVRVRGESAATYLVDLDLNPAIEERIAAKALTVVETLEELPPDPWDEKPVVKSKGKSKGKPVAESDNSSDTSDAETVSEQAEAGETSADAAPDTEGA